MIKKHTSGQEIVVRDLTDDKGNVLITGVVFARSYAEEMIGIGGIGDPQQAVLQLDEVCIAYKPTGKNKWWVGKELTQIISQCYIYEEWDGSLGLSTSVTNMIRRVAFTLPEVRNTKFLLLTPWDCGTGAPTSRLFIIDKDNPGVLFRPPLSNISPRGEFCIGSKEMWPRMDNPREHIQQVIDAIERRPFNDEWNAGLSANKLTVTNGTDFSCVINDSELQIILDESFSSIAMQI